MASDVPNIAVIFWDYNTKASSGHCSSAHVLIIAAIEMWLYLNNISILSLEPSCARPSTCPTLRFLFRLVLLTLLYNYYAAKYIYTTRWVSDQGTAQLTTS